MSYQVYHMPSFIHDIKLMNQTYHISGPPTPGVIDPERMAKFKIILFQELSEIDQIPKPVDEESTLEYLVQLLDLLSDIVVYCASEAERHGLPINGGLFAVMSSNFTKLGADGKPLIDPDTKKFLKGPNYKPPEPELRRLILELMKDKK